MRIISGLSWAATLALATLLTVAPLAFGGVPVPVRTLLQGLAFAALGMALLSGARPCDHRPALAIAAPIAGVALLGALQALPMPPGVVALLAPSSEAAWRAAGALATDASAGWPSVSVAPVSSLGAALGWLAAAAAFLAAALLGRDLRRRSLLMGTLAAVALLEVVYGVKLWLARSTVIMGVEVAGRPDRMRGTFINADHLALYLEMALAVSFAAIYLAMRSNRRIRAPEVRLVRLLLPGLCWVALFAGLAFTGSRAGLLAALLGLAAQVVSIAVRRRQLRWVPIGLSILLAGLMTVSWIGLEHGLGRLLATTSYELEANARPGLYRGAVDLWRQSPLLGTGLGTFEVAFPAMAPAELTEVVWSHAHNDWLEVLATSGLVGLALVIVAFLLLIRTLATLLRGSISSASFATALAALGAVTAVALHEGLDFGLTRPANSLTLAVLTGLAVGLCRDYESSASRSRSTPNRT